MSDPHVPEPAQLPLDVLLVLARREVEQDDPEAHTPFLVALHERPTREVFDHAAALVNHGDATKRALGVRVLRELGLEHEDGHRPFTRETVPLLRARLSIEPDPDVLRWIVSALGYHRAAVALPEVLALAGHPDPRVRFHVAAGLPSLVDPYDPQPEAVEALIQLCRDDDADIRYYSLYAATREIEIRDVEVVTRLVDGLKDDPDKQVREMAAHHRTAIVEVRRLLAQSSFDVVGDALVGPILVGLACEADVIDMIDLLQDRIQRLGATAPPVDDTRRFAQNLVTWWHERPMPY